MQGWPKLQWFITEHLQKPPRDWMAPPRLTDDTPAYVEYTTQPQDGRDELYNNRSSRKIDYQRLFSREYDFPKTFSLTENQFSGKTYFYTIASRAFPVNAVTFGVYRMLSNHFRESDSGIDMVG